MNCIVVHYSEIGLKGKNRGFFEHKLVSNIRLALKGLGSLKVSRLHGRILISLGRNREAKGIGERLLKVPGVSYFAFALSAGRDLAGIKKSLAAAAKKEKLKTFAISTMRSDKRFRLTSREINEALGDFIGKKHGWRVNLSKPDMTFFVEVTEQGAFVYTEKIRGLGGLPVTSSGRLLSLISGGIDSPVAAFEMFRRGCSVIFVHFHNQTGQRDIVKDKVDKIVKALSEYQPSTKLYMVPFGDLQKGIIMHIPARYRMIVYRRVMFAIANRIAQREGALGFVTGDSVGQVASQTLENLNVIYEKAGFPVFSPLIGRNKEEIVSIAKDIGTYELSILPYSDCCSFLVAPHPETKGRIEDIRKLEAGLDLDRLVEDALKESELKKY
ncbi:MAG: tRNA 4-thiouridine(8) synthase ThiI [Candidatus Aenigmarchaeota archaeon]|nr:tRNA 4-thiouridine(8) synthase ThiI [Candidatus Aenigmarchaeota archaeon]